MILSSSFKGEYNVSYSECGRSDIRHSYEQVNTSTEKYRDLTREDEVNVIPKSIK